MFRRSLLTLLMLSCLQASQPPTSILEKIQKKSASAAALGTPTHWTLVLNADPAPLIEEDLFLQLRSDQRTGLRLLLLADTKAQRGSSSFSINELGQTKQFNSDGFIPLSKSEMTEWNWPGRPTWALISPQGQWCAEGATLPKASDLLMWMHRGGYEASWEKLEAFLRQEPDHGEARNEQLIEKLSLALQRFHHLQSKGLIVRESPGATPKFLDGQGATGETWRERVLGDLAAGLEATTQLPGWQRHLDNLGLLTSMLGGAGLLELEPLKQALEPYRQARREQALTPSAQARLGADFHWLERSAFQSPNWLEDLEATLPPVPGRIQVPYRVLLTTVLGGFRPEGNEIHARILETWARRNPDVWELGPETWVQHQKDRGQAFGHAARGLWIAGKRDEAKALLGEAHSLSGTSWKTVAGAFKRRMKEEELREVLPLLNAEALADPKAPRECRVRLVRVGRKDWTPAWKTLQADPRWKTWCDWELKWENLESLPGVEGEGWALLTGDVIVARGEDFPAVDPLEAAVRQVGNPLLNRLDAFLKQHPQSLEGRLSRRELLLKRGLDPNLDARILEDTVQARIAPPDKVESPAWRAAAARLLPELEAELRCWPSDLATWKNWLAWNRLHPKAQSPLALAQSLAFWQGSGTWPQALPLPVLGEIFKELRARGRWAEIADWAQIRWEEWLRAEQAMRKHFPPGFEARRGQALFLEHCHNPLLEALRKLGKKSEADELEARLKELAHASGKGSTPGK